VVDEVERLGGSQADSPFAGGLNLNEIAVAGHSLGGLAALLSLKEDTRFKAAIMLDESLSAGSADMTERPVLVLAMGREQWSDEECRLRSHLHGPRFAVNFKGADHVTPSDVVWLEGCHQNRHHGPEMTIEALRDYVAGFLDANLQGKPAGRLLTGSSSECPDITVTTQEQTLCHLP